jgi:hypothetical protein
MRYPAKRELACSPRRSQFCPHEPLNVLGDYTKLNPYAYLGKPRWDAYPNYPNMCKWVFC